MENTTVSMANLRLAIAEAKSDTVVAIGHTISVKLSEKNYLPWKQQIMAMIKGHGLQKFIAAKADPPPIFESEEARSTGRVSNSYLTWQKQDHLLLSWLLSSMSESMLVRLVGCESSSEAWKRIQDFYEAYTRGKAHQYRTELMKIKKENRTITQYILQIKVLVDALNSIGCTVSDKEHKEFILEGLPKEYDTIVTVIKAQRKPYSVSEIESLLLTQEIRIQMNLKLATGSQENTALNLLNTDLKSVPLNQSCSNSRSQFPPLNLLNTDLKSVPLNQSCHNSRSQFPSSFGNAGWFSSTQRSNVQCQICSKSGHIASQCNQKYDPNFQYVNPPPGFSQSQQAQFRLPQATNPNLSNILPALNFQRFHGSVPHVTAAQPSSTVTSNSGATHPFTPDPSNLMHRTKQEYCGATQVYVGNGSGTGNQGDSVVGDT